MTEEINWREQSYNKVFDTMVRYIELQKATRPDFTIGELEAMLKTEYERDGLAWDGRGEVVEIGITARIAAMEKELIKWKNEIR